MGPLRRCAAAAAIFGVFSYTATGSIVEGITESDEAALAADDQCAEGDKECALSALQLRGHMKAANKEDGVLGTTTIRRRRTGQAEDISVAWERKLDKMIAVLARNVSAMEWKVYYMGMDLASTNETLLGVKDPKIGVNGTVVDWTKHPQTWMPVFPGADHTGFATTTPKPKVAKSSNSSNSTEGANSTKDAKGTKDTTETAVTTPSAPAVESPPDAPAAPAGAAAAEKAATKGAASESGKASPAAEAVTVEKPHAFPASWLQETEALVGMLDGPEVDVDGSPPTDEEFVTNDGEEADDEDADSDDDDDADDAKESLAQIGSKTGRRRRGKIDLRHVPPRTKRTQLYMSKEQHKLDRLWHSMTMLERNMNWMGNWMGSHRKWFHGRPVFEQESAQVEAVKAAALIEEQAEEAEEDFVRERASRSSVSGGRRRRSEEEEITDDDYGDLDDPMRAAQPQDVILNQIRASANQTVKIWNNLGKIGRLIEATKRRVHRWLSIDLIQESALEAHTIKELALLGMDLVAEDEAIADITEEDLAAWNPFKSGTTEKCCRCKTGTIGWSASGKCSFCKGSVAKTKSVSTQCTTKSAKFQGNQKCANSCKTTVALFEEEVSAQDVQLVQMETQALAADEAIAEVDAEEEWNPFKRSSSGEKCCRCKSGTTGWSASGKCSFCSGQVKKTKSPSSNCLKSNKNFLGNKQCANACKTSLR